MEDGAGMNGMMIVSILQTYKVELIGND